MDAYASVQKMASNSNLVKLVTFPEAHHAFDDKDLVGTKYMADWRNAFKNPALGVTLGYNAKAHIAATAAVRSFLQEHLGR